MSEFTWNKKLNLSDDVKTLSSITTPYEPPFYGALLQRALNCLFTRRKVPSPEIHLELKE
jgi:hypothetical protein